MKTFLWKHRDVVYVTVDYRIFNKNNTTQYSYIIFSIDSNHYVWYQRAEREESKKGKTRQEIEM